MISTRFADTSQLHFVKFPGGARSQLTFYKDSVREAAFSPVNGDSLVFSKDVGGGEFYQLYHYDLTAAERVSTLKMRFQFVGYNAVAPARPPKANLDDIKVVTTTGTAAVTLAMLDDGLLKRSFDRFGWACYPR